MSAYELKAAAQFIDGKCDMRKVFKENPALDLLGVTDMYMKENGEAIVVLPLEKKHTNVHGITHGGIYVTLLDTAMGIACHQTTHASCVTLGITTSFIANCPPGTECTTVGRVVHAGRRIMVSEGEVFDSTGKLMAKGQGTFFVLGEHPKNGIKSPDAPQGKHG